MTKFPRQRSLFGGYAPAPRDPRGRKSIAWSKETAELVVVLAAQKQTQGAIAQRVGLSVKTLARIYAEELGEAAAMIRQAVFEAQVRRATDKGSTPAARFVLAELERKDLEGGVYRAPEAAGAKPKAAPLGKKEQRQAAAEQVGGFLLPGAPPAKLTSH